MTIPEKAVDWIVKVAKDDSHGYDQASRWGSPDYDCSSLVISAYKQAGVPLQSTYTGNMRSDFLNNGFVSVVNVNLSTGAGLRPGDVLLQETHHTAMYIGDGKIVHATGNEMGGVSGGQPGDQTGREICIANYFNYSPGGWNVVLRYAREDEPEPSPVPPDRYIVQPGDSLWGIAERFLGSGSRYTEIMQLNGLTSTIIYPGQVLSIPGGNGERTIMVTLDWDTYEALHLMSQRQNKTIGEVIGEIVKTL